LAIVLGKAPVAINWTRSDGWHKQQKANEFPPIDVFNSTITRFNDCTNRPKRQITDAQKAQQRIVANHGWREFNDDDR
ncbi:hypothetical protein, partial [Coprococcus eutactus]|uniref:hypothetical protein n=1 Tax=Coprococcus eutactus TaxID=33043 RepID=UPI0027D20999